MGSVGRRDSSGDGCATFAWASTIDCASSNGQSVQMRQTNNGQAVDTIDWSLRLRCGCVMRGTWPDSSYEQLMQCCPRNLSPESQAHSATSLSSLSTLQFRLVIAPSFTTCPRAVQTSFALLVEFLLAWHVRPLRGRKILLFVVILLYSKALLQLCYSFIRVVGQASDYCSFLLGANAYHPERRLVVV